MNIESLNHDITESLREMEHTDEEITRMSADEAFDEYCTYNGLIGMGPKLRGVMENLNEAAIEDVQGLSDSAEIPDPEM
jgi:hypothetical protein